MPPSAHPYMASSAPALKQELLEATGASSVEELFEQIPESHRLRGELNLPPALVSEVELRRHLLDSLRKNVTCEETLSFLGGGCWQHHVPAICDELVARTEFVTSIWGTPSSDHGRNQTWFEFASQLAELIDMDFVGMPVYSFGCAAGHAIRMASRITGRREVLVPAWMDPERLAVIRTYCEPREMARHIDVVLVDHDPATGLLDHADLERKLSADTAAVYVENPSYLGLIEPGSEIARLAHAGGAELIVGVDPISLGVLAPPGAYGADIVVGTTQPLGVHMSCGGGVGGFIATRDDERYAREYPTLMVSLFDTIEPGERGFGLTLFEQNSYGSRERGKDWTGNSVYLWTVANAAYMALLGPRGFVELGELILLQSHYAAKRLDELPGISVSFPAGFFKEFVVNVDGTGKTIAEINRELRARSIFGGGDLSTSLPALGQSALYCVTEVHSTADIDRLVDALREVTAA